MGLAGQIKPIFSVANFNKIQKYKSLQFDNTSDIPLLILLNFTDRFLGRRKTKRFLYSNGTHIPG